MTGTSPKDEQRSMLHTNHNNHNALPRLLGPSAKGPKGGAIICILFLFAFKIVAGNVIKNIDHQIINDTAIVGNLSVTPQQQLSTSSLSVLSPSATHRRGQLNQDGRITTDANRMTMARLAGAATGSALRALGRAASYSYFYIGRKLFYLPLFFLLYWTVYSLALLLQSIASRVLHVPQHWPAAPHAPENKTRRRRREAKDELGAAIETAPMDSTSKGRDGGVVDRHIWNAIRIFEAINSFQYKK